MAKAPGDKGSQARQQGAGGCRTTDHGLGWSPTGIQEKKQRPTMTYAGPIERARALLFR